MNAVFFVLMLASLVMLLITSPKNAFGVMIDGASNAITLSIKLLAIYMVWLSVLRMMEASKLDKKLSKLLRPIVCKIFKGESEDAYDKICINLSANMLGMGGASTPAGIKAMNLMSDGSDRATDNMIMLLVINATSIQLIPATMIALRADAGAQNPSDIILPTLISSGVATLIGAIMCKVLATKHSDTNNTLYQQKHRLKPLLCNNIKFNKRIKQSK